jgi:hypothetical protein
VRLLVRAVERVAPALGLQRRGQLPARHRRLDLRPHLIQRRRNLALGGGKQHLDRGGQLGRGPVGARQPAQHGW